MQGAQKQRLYSRRKYNIQRYEYWGSLLQSFGLKINEVENFIPIYI